MSKKLTVVEKFAMVEAILSKQGEVELAEFISERSALHSKKNANRKPTANQVANEGIANAIAEFMGEHEGEKFTITALIKTVPECADLTNQKVSAIVRGMISNGIVEKSVEKGKSLFSLAE